MRCAPSPYAHGSFAALIKKIREKSLLGKKNPRLVALVDFFLSDPFNITLLQKDSEFGFSWDYVMRLKNIFKLFLLYYSTVLDSRICNFIL